MGHKTKTLSQKKLKRYGNECWRIVGPLHVIILAQWNTWFIPCFQGFKYKSKSFLYIWNSSNIEPVSDTQSNLMCLCLQPGSYLDLL